MWRPAIWNLMKIRWVASAWCRFNKGCLWADFHFSLTVNINVTIAFFMNSHWCEMKLHNILQQWIYLIIFRNIKPESTSKGPLFETSPLILFCFLFFFYVFLKHKRNMNKTYILIVCIFLQIHLDLPFLKKHSRAWQCCSNWHNPI